MRGVLVDEGHTDTSKGKTVVGVFDEVSLLGLLMYVCTYIKNYRHMCKYVAEVMQGS